jgi:acyl-CoA synthetase (AMP-forming)/AMP-acid ligase II
LDETASTTTRVVLPSQRRVVTVRELWATSARISSWIAARVDGGRAIATVLDTSDDALAFLLGSMRSGRRTASLPLPGRSSRPSEYERAIRSILEQIDAGLLVVDHRMLGLLPPLPIQVESFQAVVAAARGARPVDAADARGEFVQFTSGSTARPKGVRLSIEQISANVLSLLDRLSPAPGDGACSWLPLSHDMGLIGMVLSSLVAGGPRYAGRGDLVLISPEHFLRDPGVWLEACSRHRSTITATPDFALGMAVQRCRSTSTLDLGRLRACIVGGEPVRATSLGQFERALAACGFRGDAFCPSYGLAEATLGVTMVPPAQSWTTLRVDREALASGVVAPTAGGAVDLVSSGPPLDGVNVTVSDARPRTGHISVEGPNVFEGYLGDAPASGRIDTSDEGFVDGGQLYVLGRTDDVVVVRGRNLHVVELEDAVELLGPVRPGTCAVVSEPPGYSVALEASCSGEASRRSLGEGVRSSLVSRCGISPHRVLIVDRGTVPKTSSGKKQRRELTRRLHAAEIDVLHESTFVGTPWSRSR